MKSFTFSDLNRQSGEVLEAALKGPVKLTKRGREKLIILPANQFKALVERNTQAFRTASAPASVNDELIAGLDSLLQDADLNV
jgi:prevent-host-death family protein